MNKTTFASKFLDIIERNLCCQRNFFFEEILAELKKDPTLVDAQDKYGNTLLHYIAKFPTRIKIRKKSTYYENQHIITDFDLKAILPFNPNPFVKNNNGFTPRMEAEENPNSQLARQLSAYESSYQADCLASAIEAQSAILQHQVMEHQTYQPKTAKGVLLSERTTHSPYYRQPQEVLKARNQLQVIVKKLRGQGNEKES
ncbi:MAG: hypothetical protein IJY92_04495 [Alphaproteobacteria bacterium]|nr:hypothetical protein [Alphaproteobacteria bacterium]